MVVGPAYLNALTKHNVMSCASMAQLPVTLSNGTQKWASLDTGAATSLVGEEWVKQHEHALLADGARIETFQGVEYHTFKDGATLESEAILRQAKMRIGNAVYPVDRLVTSLSASTSSRRWMPGAPVPPRPHGHLGDWTPTQDVPIWWERFSIRLHKQ